MKIKVRKTEDYVIMTLIGINKRSNEKVNITISGARHMDAGYKRGFVIIDYVDNLVLNPGGTRISFGYDLPWYEGDKNPCEFSEARNHGFVEIKRKIGYLPKGFTINFDKFLALVYEDRRKRRDRKTRR